MSQEKEPRDGGSNEANDKSIHCLMLTVLLLRKKHFMCNKEPCIWLNPNL